MIHDFILYHSRLVVVILLAVFLFIKIVLLNMFGIPEGKLFIFRVSLGIVGRAVIDNTFHEGVQQYYKVSNKVNIIFYASVIILLLLYVVVKFYMPH